MKDFIEKVSGLSQKTWNTLKAAGPFLLSQSDAISEKYQRHLGRVAEVDALRDFLKSEVEIRKEVKKKLLDKLLDAAPEDRPRIEQDLKYTDEVCRVLSIQEKSLNYSKEEKAVSEAEENTAIEDHWLDKFNELARNRNEPWREELLARALGKETESPGSVSPRALWLIGSMEKELFEAFSKLLDICLWRVHPFTPFLPNSTIPALQRNLHNDDTVTVGHIVFKLGDIGLVADFNSQRNLKAGSMEFIRYADTARILEFNKDSKMQGVLLTPLGDSIAGFYEPEWNETGEKIFQEWLNSFPPNTAKVREVILRTAN